MVEIAEVVDRESLRAYLEGLSGDAGLLTARRVAFLAAARVAPIFLRDFVKNARLKKRDSTMLPILGSLSMSGAASTWPTPDLHRRRANAAFTGTDPAADAAVQAAANAAADAANAVAGTGLNAAFAAASAANTAAFAAANAAADAAAANAAVWELTRQDLVLMANDHRTPLPPLWGKTGPWEDYARDWAAVREALENDPSGTNWRFWITWYERVLAGKHLHADLMVQFLNRLINNDWLGDPARVNPLFDHVLAVYDAEDMAGDRGYSQRQSTTRNLKAIRSQVSTLRDFLDAEYLALSGHNARDAQQDEILDLLRELSALVGQMFERFEASENESKALVEVRDKLPAIVEKAGELAVVETEPQLSEHIVIMSASVKSLVDAGADPKLATQIAMSDAGLKKLWPRLQRLFSFGTGTRK